MRILVQRVSNASVAISGSVKSSIELGLLVLVGVETADDASDVEWLSSKLENLRIFNDADGKMNLSLKDVNGELLIISQFTLHASIKKGNRPSYIKAARPDHAIPLYESFITEMKAKGFKVGSGQFGADMAVSLTNIGPVSIWIDSKNRE